MNVRVTLTDLDTGKVVDTAEGNYIILGVAKDDDSGADAHVCWRGDISFLGAATLIDLVLRSLVDLVEETPDLKRAMGVVPALRERNNKEENEK